MLNHDVEASALLVYRNKQTGRMDMTSHEVMAAPDAGRFTLGAGRAFSAEDKEVLVDILLNTDGSIDFLDTKILVKCRTHLVWYNPPQKIDVQFKGAMYNAPIPGLVYIAQFGKPLRCYAFKGKARPTPNTPLFYVPMGNMYSSGQFCSGNVQLPKDNSISSIEGWERFVLQCTNTHANGADVLKGIPTYEGMEAFYKGLSDRNAKTFPDAKLVPVPAPTYGAKFTLDVAVKKGATE
jgi:PRTRC genetic system protein B